MQLSVTGKHLDVGKSLREYVETELNGIVTKYFEHAISADVVFTKVRHLFRADIVVNEGTGTSTLIKSNAEDDDVYSAFDLAAAKAEKQLRRYKRKIKDHHKERPDKEFSSATKYVISPNFNLDEVDAQTDESDDAPLIIAEKPAAIETLTVSDAVMRMDLGQLPAVLFKNKKTGEINVVYRREDGNISWIDTSTSDVVQNIKPTGKKAA